MGHPSAPTVRGTPAQPRVFWILSDFPNSLLIIVYLEGITIKGFMDTRKDVNITTQKESLRFPFPIGDSDLVFPLWEVEANRLPK